MKKRIFAAFASLLLLASCAAQDAAELVPAGEERTLSLYVQNGISDTAADALAAFSEKVADISGGSLTIGTTYCDDTIAALDAGCDLIFADNAEIARADSDFSAFTSPFYFYDYTHMTTTLNSDDFFSSISERLDSLLGASPLAAFYGGSRAFASNESEFLDVWDAWQGIHVTVGTDSPLLSVVLKGLGATVSERDDETVLSGFLTGEYRTIECDAASLAEIHDTRIKNERVYAYRSFHTVRLSWLMLSAAAQENLTDVESAVLREAASIALGENDTAVVEREEEAFRKLEEIGIPVFETEYENFNSETVKIFQDTVRYRNLWDWEQYETIRTMTMIE